MKNIAAFGNLGVIVFLIYIFFSGKLWDQKAWEIVLFAAIFAVPIVNLLALFSQINDRKDLLSLFWERKRLEQEKRILQLKKDIGKEA